MEKVYDSADHDLPGGGMSEDGDDGGASSVDDSGDSGGESTDWSADDTATESSAASAEEADPSSDWSESSSTSGSEAVGSSDGSLAPDAGDVVDDPGAAATDGYGVDEDLSAIAADAELGAVPGAGTAVGADGTVAGVGLAAGGVTGVDGSLVGAAGAAPGAVSTSLGTVMVDPATTVGRPDLDQAYFEYQGTGNANCGPYSAAMVLDSIMGGDGPTPEEVVEYAKQRGWMTQDFATGQEAWGYWSGMTEDQLEQLMDDYLAESGGDAVRTRGELGDLEQHLASGHPVVVAVDSGEMVDGGEYNPSDEQNPNHFLQVTGIDRTNGLVFLNDPGKTAPSVVPLAQFEAAWRDSGNLMLDARAGAGTGAPSAADAAATSPEAAAPLVSLPTTAATVPAPSGPDGVPAAPGLLSDPTLAAVPAAPVPADPSGCCVLPFTLALTPAGPSGVAPPAPVDPSAAPGQSVVPNQAGGGAAGDLAGGGVGGPPGSLPAGPLPAPDPLVPLPAGPLAERIDDTHIKLNYVPEQIGVQPPRPAGSGVSGAAATAAIMENADALGNVFFNTISDGVTRTGTSSTGYSFEAAHGRYDTLGEAQDARDRNRGLL